MPDFLTALQSAVRRITRFGSRAGGDLILQCDHAAKIGFARSRERGSLWVVAIAYAINTTTICAAENAPSKGKTKAEVQCNVCHGANGLSQIPNAPNLAGQPEIYLIEQLKNYRSGKRANEVMSILAKPLSDDDIANLAAWYASIEIKAVTKP